MSFVSVLKALEKGDHVHVKGESVEEEGPGIVSKNLKVLSPHSEESGHELDILVAPITHPDNTMVMTITPEEEEVELKQTDIDGFRDKTELRNVYEVQVIKEER